MSQCSDAVVGAHHDTTGKKNQSRSSCGPPKTCCTLGKNCLYQHESEHLEELYIDNELSDVPLHHQENEKTEQTKTTENTERARAAAQQLQQKCRTGK